MKKIAVLFLVLVSLLLTACQSEEGMVTGTRTRTVIRTSWANGYAEDVSYTLYYVQLDYDLEIEVTKYVYGQVEMGDRCTFKGKKPHDSVSCISPTRKAGDE